MQLLKKYPLNSANNLRLTGLASHILHSGLLTPENITIAVQQAREQGLMLVSYLVRNHILSSEEIAVSCSKSFGLAIADLKDYDFKYLCNDTLSLEHIRHYRIIPLEKHNGILHIGTADPTDQYALDAIMFHTGLKIFPLIVAENKLNEIIEKYYTETITEKNLELSLLREINLEENLHVTEEKAITYDEPLIKLVDHVIEQAIQQAASDIHIEPYADFCRIRYRRDGILYEVTTIPAELAARFVTRLKVMAKLDIAERRLPQDGRFQLHHSDLRMNSCPTLFGEKIVLRLLKSNKISLDLGALGLSATQRNLFINKITEPHGMILVTGPTGSGKTVTLYSALNYLNSVEKNISTIEDPIEIQLAGINQVNIHPKIGLDFATVLRALLRQDPDIIMVGEIRDQVTAEIAIQAANTGHLVLSTLHTNSAIEALSRLTSMGIAKYNLVSSLTLIIAQRLIRKLCPHCKEPDTLSPNILGVTNQKIFCAKGCEHCLYGYLGRTGIYECLPITEKISELILSGATFLTIKKEAQLAGFTLLDQAGKTQILAGMTSIMEITRVLQT